MIIDLIHNRIVKDTISDSFAAAVSDKLVPMLQESYGARLLGVQMYEDYIKDNLSFGGFWYYPLTVILPDSHETVWIKWNISNARDFRDGIPYAFIGEELELCIAEDTPEEFKEKLSGRSTYFEGGYIKINIHTNAPDPTFLSGRYSQTFVDEMARQITAELSKAMSVSGLADSSIELSLVFAPDSYMEHTSENTTYRRLLMSAKGCTPRDFWIRWTRSDSAVAYSVNDNVSGSDVVFELGEDVPHKVREKEYRFLVYGNSDKYRNAMGRKNITEWREIIKRAVKRGELTKNAVEIAEEDTEIKDKLSDILAKCGISSVEASETVIEEKPASPEFSKAMEIAMAVASASDANEEKLGEQTVEEAETVDCVTEGNPFAAILQSRTVSDDNEESDGFMSSLEFTLNDGEAEKEETAASMPSETDFEEEEEANLNAFLSSLGLTVRKNEPSVDKAEVEPEEELGENDGFVASDADEAATEEITEEASEDEPVAECEEEIAEPEAEESEDCEVICDEESLAECEPEDDLSIEENPENTEEEIEEESASAPTSPSPFVTYTNIYEDDEAEVCEASEPEAASMTDTERETLEARIRELEQAAVELEEKNGMLMDALRQSETLRQEQEAELRRQLELEAKERAREKLLFAEAAKAAKEENERVARERDAIEAQRREEAAARMAEDAARVAEAERARQEEERAQEILRIESAMAERAANRQSAMERVQAMRARIEEQARRRAGIISEETDNTDLVSEEVVIPEAEETETESVEKFVSAPISENVSNVSVDEAASPVAEAAEEKIAAEPRYTAPVGEVNAQSPKHTYTSKLLRIQFRNKVDPNVTAVIHRLMSEALEKNFKTHVYMKVKATIPEENVVLLNFVKFPQEEMELLVTIINHLGAAKIGITKIILE